MNQNPITEYTITWGDTHATLIDSVNDFISQGWEPIGAPFLRGPSACNIHQALIKRAANENAVDHEAIQKEIDATTARILDRLDGAFIQSYEIQNGGAGVLASVELAKGFKTYDEAYEWVDSFREEDKLVPIHFSPEFKIPRPKPNPTPIRGERKGWPWEK